MASSKSFVISTGQLEVYMTYAFLVAAIFAEVAATLALKSTEGFSRLAPLTIVVLGYGSAFFCLSLTLRQLPLGTVYAIWSGAGILLVALAGWVFHRQTLDARVMFGMALILSGIVIIYRFSPPDGG